MKTTVPLIEKIVPQAHETPDNAVVSSLQQSVHGEKNKVLRIKLSDIKNSFALKTQHAVELDARLDILTRRQAKVSILRVCYLNADSYWDLDLKQIYKQQENDKKLGLGLGLFTQRVMDMEHWEHSRN